MIYQSELGKFKVLNIIILKYFNKCTYFNYFNKCLFQVQGALSYIPSAINVNTHTPENYTRLFPPNYVMYTGNLKRIQWSLSDINNNYKFILSQVQQLCDAIDLWCRLWTKIIPLPRMRVSYTVCVLMLFDKS